MDGCLAGKALDAELPAQHPLDVAVENRRPLPESESGHRRCRRAADTRQFSQQFGAGRKLAAVLAGNLLRTFVEIPRPGVITQPGPVLDYRIDRRSGQRRDTRKTVEKAPVIRDHRGNLRLLQHDLGKPDAVRVARVLPGQVVAAGHLLPGDQLFGKVQGGGQILSRRKLREPG